MAKTIDELIHGGNQFNFNNNSAYNVTAGDRFTAPNKNYLAWITEVEHYINANYGADSAPFKLYSDFNRKKLEGYDEEDFNSNHAKVMGALVSCQSIGLIPAINKQNKSNKKSFKETIEDHPFKFMIAAFVVGFGTYQTILSVAQLEPVRKENYVLKEDVARNYITKEDLTKNYLLKTKYDSLININSGFLKLIFKLKSSPIKEINKP